MVNCRLSLCHALVICEWEERTRANTTQIPIIYALLFSILNCNNFSLPCVRCTLTTYIVPQRKTHGIIKKIIKYRCLRINEVPLPTGKVNPYILQWLDIPNYNDNYHSEPHFYITLFHTLIALIYIIHIETTKATTPIVSTFDRKAFTYAYRLCQEKIQETN